MSVKRPYREPCSVSNLVNVCLKIAKSAKEFPAFWEELQLQHPFNIAQAYFIDDTEKVLLGAQKFGLQHLISIQQPSSIGLVRDESPFPMLKHLTDFIPLLEQAEEHKQYA